MSAWNVDDEGEREEEEEKEVLARVNQLFPIVFLYNEKFIHLLGLKNQFYRDGKPHPREKEG